MLISNPTNFLPLLEPTNNSSFKTFNANKSAKRSSNGSYIRIKLFFSVFIFIFKKSVNWMYIDIFIIQVRVNLGKTR